MTDDRLAIEYLSVFGLPPVEFVRLAAELGVGQISMGLTAMPLESLGYPHFSLRDDSALRRDMGTAMYDCGVQISLGEGFLVVPGADCRAYAADLDLMRELGAPRINTLGLDPDRDRTFDQFAILTELAAERGMQTTLEMMPGSVVGDLDTALAAVRHVGRQDFRLLIDTMHLGYSGAGADDIRALDPAVIGYVQLSDMPVIGGMEDYLVAATFERMIPGTGTLPLADILDALPRDVHVGLEVPMRTSAEAGVGPLDRLRPCVEAARVLVPT
ncbi:sugar phosphate isomerase/epimerase family protein [Mycolicibacterium vaccae]|uniref:Xylose isomerase domain-containing protein n=1 Tax=Mycolicibacterium vaccae ATCC 25954 TaxID=1194972 RepID=K0ULH7_MYCVA|nr:TIM barrel protein [Mycolicibacterium vaccae]ANI42488.1 xylose isomerase [Mycolicibacterium vaccae 95051]EJZ07982.1 xylose isomerase domain-containing protein [Mycolicibacterium vaccae ATCC 25954]